MTMWDQVTDAERERIVVRIVGALPASDIPDHLREGLVRYFSDGIMPGSFLQAVLCNDLIAATGRADPFSRAALPAIVQFLIDNAPARAWGSHENVLAWTTTPDRLEV